MTTTPHPTARHSRTALALLLTTTLSLGLITLVGLPETSAETPEERCKRETEAYNQAWQDQWRRTHPKEVEKGIQPPRPNPPYMCFGGPTPSATPSPIPTPPPAPGAADIPGSNPGGGTNPDGSPRPEWTRLKEAPTTIPHSPTSTQHYPYGHDYTHDHGYHYTPVSPTSNTQTSPTQPGRINPGGDNNIPNTGGGTTHHGGQPHYDDPPAPKKRNIIQRLWDKITGNKVEEQHTREDTSTPGGLNKELDKMSWEDWKKEKRHEHLQRIQKIQIHQCAVVPKVPSAGYPRPSRGDLSDAVDLGFRIVLDGQKYAIFGDSFAKPKRRNETSPDGTKYVRLIKNAGTRPFTIWKVDKEGHVQRRAHVRGDVPQGRFLPGGVIDDGDPNSEIIMLTELDRKEQRDAWKKDPKHNLPPALNAGPHPGILYRVTKDAQGNLHLKRTSRKPLPKNTSAISGYKDKTPDGKTMYYFVTTTFQRDNKNGLVSWRARDINNPDTWEWYDADTDTWNKYNRDGTFPSFMPGTGTSAGQSKAPSIAEPYYRKLPDGTIVLMYLEGNKIKMRLSHSTPGKLQPVLTQFYNNACGSLPPKAQETFNDPKVQDFFNMSGGAEMLAWSPEISFNIYNENGLPVGQPYAPIIEPETKSIFDLILAISQWTGPKDPGLMKKSYRYGVFPMQLGPFSDDKGTGCKTYAQSKKQG